MPSETILICTVGGSHQPIVTAINELHPDFICFVCSEKDQGTGKPGSDTQIRGKGIFLKANRKDSKASLPNIPTQFGLDENSFQIILIPADDLDQATDSITMALINLKERFPDSQIVADYTGGTKTMSAALVVAALETDGIKLQLVTGNRADLVKVRNGTEACTPANVDAIRLQRLMSPYLSAWTRFAYDETAIGLVKISRPHDKILNSKLSRALDLSRAFSAWDRFDHAEARSLLEDYTAKNLGKYFDAVKRLVEESEQQEPARLFDLWRNAQRRATQGRYDDAVARCYRLIEWTAQWILRSQCRIDTSDIAPKDVPDGVELVISRKGKHQAGLYSSWLLVEKMTSGGASRFFTDHSQSLRDHIEKRNHSILAHGFSPVQKEMWESMDSWMADVFLPMLLEETKAVRLRKEPPQLPSEYVWFE